MPHFGLYPGHTTFNCATLGFGFIEIIIEPSRGGSELETYDIRDSRRLVTVIVHFKDHQWKQSMLIETIVLDKVIQVLSSIRSIVKSTISVIAKVKSEMKGITVTAQRHK